MNETRRKEKIDQLVVLVAFRKAFQEQRFRYSAALARLAGREDRDSASGAFNQFEVRNLIAHLLARGALEKSDSLNHNQNIELA